MSTKFIILRLLILLLILSIGNIAFAQPANDDCADAITITISNDGYDLDTFTTAYVDLSDATIQSFDSEAFHSTITAVGNDKKSVWYKFTLPTTRYLEIGLLQFSTSIAEADVGCALYKSSSCMPSVNDIEAAKLSPLSKFGWTSNECVPQGTYYLQISSKANVNDSVYIKLITNYPYVSTTYDYGSNAYYYGIIQTEYTSSSHYYPSAAGLQIDLGCYSMDSIDETYCSDLGADSIDYDQTIWQVFTTDNEQIIDLVRYELYSTAEYNPGTLGVNIFQGDVRTDKLEDMTMVNGCNTISMSSGWKYLNIKCDLLSNTVYSVQLLAHKDTINKTIYARIAQLGMDSTKGAKPSNLHADNSLGTLPSSAAGEVTSETDVLACNSYVTNNLCGDVNPVTATDTMNTWYTFTLSGDADVTISTSTYNIKRLYSGDVETDCGLTSPTTFTTAVYSYSCMPAGDYSLQILGVVSSESSILSTSSSRLGRSANISIRVTDLTQVNNFDLDAINRVDSINKFNDLEDDIIYESTQDRFGCDNTVMPTGHHVDDVKTSYRILTIGDADGDLVNDSAILSIWGGSSSLTYTLYKGNASAEADPTYPSPPATINNLTDNSGRTYTHSTKKFCVIPGAYTLASFAQDNDVGQTDQPKFKAQLVVSSYSNPNTPYNFGDITAMMASYGTLTNTDYFDCKDNSLAIDGYTPCYNYTKQIYRQFYISTATLLKITKKGSGYFRIFNGKVSDGSATLSDYEASCASSSWWVDYCTLLPAGWYTIVTYGSGPNYGGTNSFDYMGGHIGNYTTIEIAGIASPNSPSYNRPYKTYNAGTTDYGENDGTDALPDYDTTYTFGTEEFDCIADAPFTGYITTCSAEYNRMAFYKFTITKESYAYIHNIASTYNIQVFNADVVSDTNLTDNTPIQECIGTKTTIRYNYGTCDPSWTGSVEFCKLQSGTYTLVILATDNHIGSTVTPKLTIDKVASSQHDHAWNAYDFGIVPGDSLEYFKNESVSDTGIVDGRNASNDIFSCLTGAHDNEPDSNLCYQGGHIGDSTWSVEYPMPNNANLYHTATTTIPVRRTLWYTFQIVGPGKVTVGVYNKTNDKTISDDDEYQYPFGIYRSDESYTGSFTNLKGGSGTVDSTIAQGLTFVTSNRRPTSCVKCGIQESISFEIEPCSGVETVRYYLIVDDNAFIQVPNQLDIGIKFEDIEPVDVEFDWYGTANDLNTKHSKTNLDSGLYVGDTATFACTNHDTILYQYNNETDEPCDTSDMNSLWYKFKVDISGKIRVNYVVSSDPATFSTNELLIYKEITSGDTIEPGLNPEEITTVTEESQSWAEVCMSPGTYYVIITGCGYSIEEVYPRIWIVDQKGDLCSNPINMTLTTPATLSDSVMIDCHTIGDDFGEDKDNPYMGCLYGPENYKTTWFHVRITDATKMDLTVSLTENTTAFPNQIRYRMLYGSCGAMTANICNSDAGTEFTLNCMKGDASDYYFQVVSPEDATGELKLTVTAVAAEYQDCKPPDPASPVANFTYTGNCIGDSICFSNQSTLGDDMVYHWDFGIDVTLADTSILLNPCYLYTTAVGDIDTFTVTLIAKNNATGKADTVTSPVYIFRKPTSTDITNNAASFGDHIDTLRAAITYLMDGDINNLISNPVSTLTWDFGDDSTDANNKDTASHTYCATCVGDKNITLSVTSGLCIVDFYDTITVVSENIFEGGFFGGFDSDTSAQTSCPPENIWNGGYYDGSEREDGLIVECPPQIIWNGGFFAGADNDTIEVRCPPEDIWNGGFYDGYVGSFGQVYITVDGTASGVSDTICEDETVTLSAESTGGGAFSYLWSTTATSKTIDVTPTADSTFSVTLTDDYGGCALSYSASINIIVYDSAKASAGTAGSLCETNSVQIGTASTELYHEYIWTNGSSLDNDAIAQPTATPTATTTYTVTVSTLGGICPEDTDEVIVTFLALPDINSIMSDSIFCTGDAIDLISDITTDSVWWFKDTLSFDYKMPVTISNYSTSALTNHQIKIKVNTTNLITNNKMQSDCDDIRIYDTDNSTPLDFWVVDGTCNTTETEIWINVPSMNAATVSADLATGGTVSASTEYSALYPDNDAFDDDEATCWGSDGSSLNEWLEYDLGTGNGKIITSYKMLCKKKELDGLWNSENWNPKTWIFQGSNDGSSWTDLDVVSDGALTMTIWNTFEFENSISYEKYRINVTDNEGADKFYRISEMEFYNITPTNKVVNLHYGDFSADNIGNGDDVFLFFDDFSGASLDVTKWTNTKTSPTISDGELILDEALEGIFGGNYAIPENTIWESSVYSNVNNQGSPLRGISTVGETNASWDQYIDNSINVCNWIWSNGDEMHVEYYGGQVSNVVLNAYTTGYHHYVIKYRMGGTDNHYFDYDDGTETQTATETSNTNGLLYPCIYTEEAQDVKANWIFIRKYIDFEPSYSIGSESYSAVSSDILARNDTLKDITSSANYILVLEKNGCAFVQDTINAQNSSAQSLCWRSRQDGDWKTTATWQILDTVGADTWVNAEDYSGCISSPYPTSRDSTIEISSGDSVVYNTCQSSGVDELTINGILTIKDDSTFYLVDSSSSPIAADVQNNGKLYITGILSKVGTALLSNHDNSTVIYNNSSAQTMWNGTYGKLIAEGGSIKTVGGAATKVNTSVSFKNGSHIQLGSRNIKLMENATIPEYSETAGYFITDTLGSVIKYGMGNGGDTTFTFPVGSSTSSYNRAIVTNDGTYDDIRLRVYDNFMNDGDISCDAMSHDYAVDRTWYLAEGIEGGSDITLKLYWKAAHENSSFKDYDCYMGEYSSTNGWIKIGSNEDVSALSPRYLSVSGIDTLSHYSVGSCGGSKYIYRTVADGNWIDDTKWEIYIPAQDDWFPPSSAPCTCGDLTYPTSSDSTIYVRHAIDFTTWISNGVDELHIQDDGGILTLTDSMKIVNGPGVDLKNDYRLIIPTKLVVASGATFQNETGSMVHYSGTTQDIHDVTYYALWIGGNTSLTLAQNTKDIQGNNTIIADTLRFIHGIVNLDSYDMTLVDSATITANHTDSGWVNATGSGSLVWEFSTGSSISRVFPVGGTYYSPATIIFNSVTTVGELKCRVTENNWYADNASLFNPGELIDRYWTFSTSGSSIVFDEYDADLYYDNFDLPSAPASESEELSMVDVGFAYSLAYTQAANWKISSEKHITYSATVSSNKSSITNTAFSDLMPGSEPDPPDVPLPVTLLNFHGSVIEAGAFLYWNTAIEINNYGFYLERSINGIEYSEIAFIEGAGSATNINSYNFTDNEIYQLKSNIAFYRLRQVDYNGSIIYSKTISLIIAKENDNNFELDKLITIYPNPVSIYEKINIVYLKYRSGAVTLEICDMEGKSCYQEEIILNRGKHTIEMPVKQYSPGLYFIKIKSENSTTNSKFIITK